MAPHSTDSIEIALDDPATLFTPPQADPLAGRFETRSGMERLLGIMSLDRAQRRFRSNIVIRMPAGAFSAEQEPAYRAAIAGYCTSRLADLDQESRQLQSNGRHALVLGLGFLAICLALSGTFSNTAFLPDFVHRLLAEGFNIAGWVGLWRPVELLLYDAAPLRRDRAVLRSLRNRQIQFVPG